MEHDLLESVVLVRVWDLAVVQTKKRLGKKEQSKRMQKQLPKRKLL